MSEWKWFVGFAPSIGWELAFQARADLMDVLEAKDAPERFRMRRPTKLEIVKEKGSQEAVMKGFRWTPGFFGALDIENGGILSRNLFTWISPASEAAAQDWTDSWEKPVSPLIMIPDGDGEAATRALAAEAKAKSNLAKALKNPHLTKV